MDDMLIGTTAGARADVELMKAAGIGWVRHDFSFPFEDRIGGELTADFRAEMKQAKAWTDKGLKVLGITPLPGLGRNEPDAAGGLRLKWHSRMPAWFGTPGTKEYLKNYRELCAFLGRELAPQIGLWQVANELDIEIFAGPLDLRQACELITAGARGLKDGNPSAVVGTNSVYFERSFYLYGRLFTGPDACLDYCGVDSYFGSWRAGGPENWDACITELGRITQSKILVNEWGFASRGTVMTRDNRQLVDTGTPACQFRQWQYGWREGHSEDLQAAYVRAVFEVLGRHREQLVGAFFYRWEDQEKCWQCGRSDCPLETAWGMVDSKNHPKAAYAAFRDSVKKLRGV